MEQMPLEGFFSAKLLLKLHQAEYFPYNALFHLSKLFVLISLHNSELTRQPIKIISFFLTLNFSTVFLTIYKIIKTIIAFALRNMV
jgi:hypothetical protein